MQTGLTKSTDDPRLVHVPYIGVIVEYGRVGIVMGHFVIWGCSRVWYS